MSTRPATIPNERRAGLILVALGVLALLADTGWLGGADDLVGGLLFAVVGAVLLRGYRRGCAGEGAVWRLPVGLGAFGLAAAAITSGDLSGVWFLGLVAVGFALVYAHRRDRWWALIPAGAVGTLALVAALDELPLPLDAGPVFFLGLAATFGLVFRSGRRWARWPALGALALAVLALLSGAGWLMPLLLLGAGAWLLRRGGASIPLLGGRERAPAPREAPRGTAHDAPAAPPAATPAPAPAPAPAAAPAAAQDPAPAPVAPAADEDEDPRPGSA